MHTRRSHVPDQIPETKKPASLRASSIIGARRGTEFVRNILMRMRWLPESLACIHKYIHKLRCLVSFDSFSPHAASLPTRELIRASSHASTSLRIQPTVPGLRVTC